MKKRTFFIFFSIVIVLSLGSIGYTVVQYLGQSQTSNREFVTNTEKKEEEFSKTSSFTFVGVGDNLIHQAIFSQYQSGDTDYSFDNDYALMKPYIEPADLAFINQETICAGEKFGLSHYPMFNGPTQILDAVVNTGFDWLATSSNHSLDKGSDALIAELNYIHDNYPEVSTTGTNRTEEESETYVVRDIHGIKVGLLGYTYGTNGISIPSKTPWLVELIDEDQIQKDMLELSQVSDVQIVSMHWGTEYHTEIEDEQRELAKKMNDWGVEVIIGTHPHVIKPAEIIHGDDQDTLCYYSLGNFLSAQDTNNGMVGGMASFSLNYDLTNKKTTFEDVKFIPTVTYYDPSFTTFQVMTIHDYNNDYVPSHYVTTLGYDMSKEWIQNYVQYVMGEPEGIEVVIE